MPNIIRLGKSSSSLIFPVTHWTKWSAFEPCRAHSPGDGLKAPPEPKHQVLEQMSVFVPGSPQSKGCDHIFQKHSRTWGRAKDRVRASCLFISPPVNWLPIDWLLLICILKFLYSSSSFNELVKLAFGLGKIASKAGQGIRETKNLTLY